MFCTLAGLFPAALMSEVLTDEGEMARDRQVEAFADRFGCRVIDVEQICRAVLGGEGR